jgi:tRNA(His) 5'-end guanylyltransferase
MILNTTFWVLLIICVLRKPLETGNYLCFLHQVKKKSWLYYASSPLFKSRPTYETSRVGIGSCSVHVMKEIEPISNILIKKTVMIVSIQTEIQI